MPAPDDTKPPSPRDLQARIESERTGLPFLLWHDGDGAQRILMLTGEKARVTIGRREHNDVPLTWDTEVSREHAILEPVGETWTLIDDGLSRNGSFVNGNSVHGRHKLQHRDRMCFGATHVSFFDPDEGHHSSSTARAPEAGAGIPVSGVKREVLIALARPVFEKASSTPATNPQIAAEVHRSVDAVKAHLRELFDQFGLGELAQNEKRGRLVAIALSQGILRPHDF
jgi:pSer/pThr/pTyr-binding forkhead associated (FHA) protein